MSPEAPEGAAGGVTVGIDIGGTKTAMGFLAAGGVETFFHGPTPADPLAAADAVERGLRAADLPGPVARIGIGCPGPLDQRAGVVLSPPNLPQWRDFHIKAELQRRLGVPVRLDNDANAAALGEAVHGAGRGYRRVFYVGIGTGIGTGIVLDGRVYRGARGVAGEMWDFRPGAFRGEPGGENITELASGKGLLGRAGRLAKAEGREPFESTAAVLAAAEEGNPAAARALARARQVLAAAVSFALHVVAPDVVVIGGGLSEEEGWFIEPVRRLLGQSVRIPALAATPIVRAALRQGAGLYGAIELFGAGAPPAGGEPDEPL